MKDIRGCPSREQWDRYLLGEELIERKELEWHLAMCSFCRLLVNERRNFLAGLTQVWNEASRPTVIEFRLIAGAAQQLQGSGLLAAKGDSEDSTPETATLSSSEQEMLLRVLRDAHSQEVWMYLIAEDPAMYANVIVKPFGEEREYVTDSQGRINLGVIEWPQSNLLKAEVHLPKALFNLSLMKDLPDERPTIILTTPGGDEIKVAISGKVRQRCLEIELVKLSDFSSEIPLKVAIRETGKDGMLQVRTLASDRASFDNIKALDRLEIYLFQ